MPSIEYLMTPEEWISSPEKFALALEKQRKILEVELMLDGLITEAKIMRYIVERIREKDMTRVLLLDDVAKEKIKKIKEWAEQPANMYKPGITQTVPGDDPMFVCLLEKGFRCVFTITEQRGLIFRHLSISIENSEKYPSPWAAYMIAAEFGFEGWDGKSIELPQSWRADVSKTEHCVVLFQPCSFTN
jgi:hypothetical protein